MNENNQKNNNIKIVIPPHPGRKKPTPPQNSISKPQETSLGVLPVRVAIPPHPGRKKPAQTKQDPPPQDVKNVQVALPRHPGHGSVRAEKTYEQLARLASSVVMIMIHDKDGEPVGSGSGIMIGRNGYILTNQHVASGGSFYTVRIEDDDRNYRTNEIIKYNDVLDLSVIRIDRTLQPLPVYNGAQKLVRGQRVIAIGSPMGLFNSVSDGIISGFRKLDGVDMIQFTAPVSPGSSGGAVLNMYGEVIGISTAIMRDAQNINIAVGYEYINMFVRGFTG